MQIKRRSVSSPTMNSVEASLHPHRLDRHSSRPHDGCRCCVVARLPRFTSLLGTVRHDDTLFGFEPKSSSLSVTLFGQPHILHAYPRRRRPSTTHPDFVIVASLVYADMANDTASPLTENPSDELPRKRVKRNYVASVETLVSSRSLIADNHCLAAADVTHKKSSAAGAYLVEVAVTPRRRRNADILRVIAK